MLCWGCLRLLGTPPVIKYSKKNAYLKFKGLKPLLQKELVLPCVFLSTESNASYLCAGNEAPLGILMQNDIAFL